MLRILLPYPPRLATLRSFWLVVSAGGGAAVTTALAVTASPWMAGAAALAAAVVGALGWLWPRAVALPYRAWNRAARGYGVATRWWLLALWYVVVFPLVGLTGSSLRLAPDDGSLWVRRTTGPGWNPSAGGDVAVRGWIATLVGWSVRSENPWIAVLVPFLAVLNALEGDDEREFPPGIYTLF